ncbi:hypothetical protein MMPV_009306 [Pyropia vietnamensis]
MTARFLGHPPSFYATLGIAPRPALSTHVGLFARCFGVPATDLRLPGSLSPAARRLGFLAASAAFRCDYCTAHAASFGDMLRGPAADGGAGGPSAAADAAALGAVATTQGEGEKGAGAGAGATPDALSAAVVAYARAAVVRPLTPTAAAAVHDAVAELADAGMSATAIEGLTGVVAFVGALNTVMDCMGVVLEASSQRFAMEVLPPVSGGSHGRGVGTGGWVPGEHHANSAVNIGAGTADDAPAVGASPSFPLPWILRGVAAAATGAIRNVGGMLATMPAAVRGQFVEAHLYAGLPTSVAGLRGWVDGVLGSGTCLFLTRLTSVRLARAFCFGLRENVTAGVGGNSNIDDPKASNALSGGSRSDQEAEGEGEWARAWSPIQRARLLYVFGDVTECPPITTAAIAFAARASGRDKEAVAAETAAWAAAPPSPRSDDDDKDDGKDGGSDDIAGTARLAAAREVVLAAAGGTERVRGPVVTQLMSVASARAAVELASLVSFAEMWRRMEVLIGPDTPADKRE